VSGGDTETVTVAVDEGHHVRVDRELARHGFGPVLRVRLGLEAP